jgi:hypothetical protein
MMIIRSRITNAFFAVLMFVFVTSSSGYGLPAYKIRGIVLNHETSVPIPLAEVFVSGTTFGSISNAEGEFELKTSYLPCQLVVSHISYAPFTMMIDKESMSYLTIKLIPYEHEIKEITVEALSMRRENMEVFRQAFLGMDEYASACTILNDSVLSFRWDSSVFSASAYQPILVDNSKLGYRIKIILEDFKLVYDPVAYKKIQKNKRYMSNIAGALYQMQGEFFFIQHPPGKKGKQERITQSRLKAYFGSRMHFLRSLYLGNPKKHGYDIKPDFYLAPINGNRDLQWPGIELIFLDPLGYPDKLLTYPEKPMMIEFVKDYSGKPVNLNQDSGIDLIHHQSKLTFGSKKCTVRYNGTTYDYSLIFSGYIGEQRISMLLPDDFVPGE